MNGTLQRQRDRIAELTNDIEKYKSENEELTESSIELQMQVQRATTSRDSYASQLDELTKEYEGVCVLCMCYVCTCVHMCYVHAYRCIVRTLSNVHMSRP